MVTNIFLMIIIIILIFYIAYLNKLHYNEIRGLYSKLGINVDIKRIDEKKEPTKVKNHIKQKMKQQGGE